jgi:hypothetical protein
LGLDGPVRHLYDTDTSVDTGDETETGDIFGGGTGRLIGHP